MKKTIKSIAIVALLTGVSVSTATAMKSGVNYQDPTEVVTAYFQAESNGDVDRMVELVRDPRFQDEKQQKSDYENVLKKHQLKEYKIRSSNRVDDTHIEFLVDLQYTNVPTLPPLPYKVVKENGQWKLFLETLDVNMVQGSPDYGKVTVNNFITRLEQ